MSLSSPSLQEQPAKRMRLGTKSCTECRRRKIRCKFSQDGIVCESCNLRDLPCKPQQAKRSAGHAVDSVSTDILQSRVEQLEAIVKTISSVTAGSAVQSSCVEAPGIGIDYARENDFRHAPLLRLLNDSDVGHELDPTRVVTECTGEKQQEVLQVVQSLAVFLPRAQNLDRILAATETYWQTWPLYFYGPDRLHTFRDGHSSQARQILTSHLRSPHPAVIAKAISWLALCIQMLPKQDAAQRSTLAGHPSSLVDQFIQTGKRLVSIDEELGGTIEGVEAMVMQHRLFLNAGKVKRAWLLIRQASAAATCLGLHRMDQNIERRHKDLWTMIWMSERHEAALLGLPASMSRNDKSLLTESQTDSQAEQALKRTALLFGNLIARDQDRHSAPYSTSIQLDCDLEEVRKAFPGEWWQEEASQNLPYLELFHREWAKFQYFLLLKLIHLPYMLKSIVEHKYSHSWYQTIAASYGMLRSYCDFRSHPKAKANFCESMDFFTFSAAVTLVIALLSQPGLFSTAEKEKHWNMIMETRQYLYQIATETGSVVAHDASAVLDVLISARHGRGLGQESYIVSIPYFGRIRLDYCHLLHNEKSHRVVATRSSSTSQVDSGAHVTGSSTDQSDIFGSLLELQTNLFGNGLGIDANLDQELRCNWSLEAFNDQTFDWSQTFTYETTTAGD